MSNNDQLLNAKTFPAFLKAANKKYQLDLPTDFSGDSPVSKLMQTNINVKQVEVEGILYEARGDPFKFENSNLKAKMSIAVVTSDYINQNCYKRCIYSNPKSVVINLGSGSVSLPISTL